MSLRSVVGSLTQDARMIQGLKTMQDSGVREGGGQEESLRLCWVGAELDRPGSRGKWRQPRIGR